MYCIQMRTILFFALALVSAAQPFDYVVAGGRVIDPESGLDAVRHVGIRGGKVVQISATPLAGKRQLDAQGMIVAPGFIDLHWHGRDPASDAFEIQDGVTTSFELEIGVADPVDFAQRRAGKSLVNHGASVGHVPIRMAVLGDSGDLLPADKGAYERADPEQITSMKVRMEQALKAGAPAVGFVLAYTQGATYWEVLEMFRMAAKYKAPCFVHMRGPASGRGGENERIQGLVEVIAAAATTGASLHIVHMNSSSHDSVERMLQIVGEARANRLDVTTEAYPYAAGATKIESALFNGWEDRKDVDFSTMQWIATGERLTRETFLKYRKERGMVIVHSNVEENVRKAILSPLTMIASDGFDVTANGHPRSAGTFCRVLGRYVREQKGLSWNEAIAKMTIQPAKRLESRVPAMRGKGRLRAGADADVVVFNPTTVTDKSTYEKPAQASEGMKYVLVNGTLVLDDGKLVDHVFPGKAIQAPAVP